MKFSVGDIVSYGEHKRHGDLNEEFVERWGYGPFEIVEIHGENCILATLHGDRVKRSPDFDWHHTLENLRLDPFLDAARKAIANEAR